MAADEGTPKEPRGKSVEQQVSNLLGYLETPIKQVQEWVSSGQLQSTIEQLQEHAERAQEGVERSLRVLNEVRQGVQTHVKNQIEGYQREKAEHRQRRMDAAIARVLSPPEEPSAPATTPEESPAPKAKGSGSRKKPSRKKSSGRKQ